jgi:hypothetical protein
VPFAGSAIVRVSHAVLAGLAWLVGRGLRLAEVADLRTGQRAAILRRRTRMLVVLKASRIARIAPSPEARPGANCDVLLCCQLVCVTIARKLPPVAQKARLRSMGAPGRSMSDWKVA